MLGNIRFKLLIFPTAILNVKYIELSLFRILCGHALRATEFLDNHHVTVVRLSSVRTDHLYPAGYTAVTHFR